MVRQQIWLAKELIWWFDIAQENRWLSISEIWFWSKLKKKMLELCSLECTIARQRLRVKWLREGDSNIRLFHLQVNHRKRRSLITQLKVDNGWIRSHSEINQAFHKFFVNLIGKPASRAHTLDLDYLNVPSHDHSSLDASFFEDEVWEAIKSLPAEKAPGPDGYIALF